MRRAQTVDVGQRAIAAMAAAAARQPPPATQRSTRLRSVGKDSTGVVVVLTADMG